MFAGYEVGRIIGSGAMGVVYQAHDPKLGRDVALKVVAEHLAQDEAFRARFAQEAKSAARVEHPGVVAIYQTGEEDGIPFLAMRLVRGRELSAILEDRGKLPLAEALRLLRPIAGGLDAAHAANIVHRDVKPANILVPDDGSDPVLVDFGIGRVMQGTRATQTGSWVGTVDYVSPEQIRGGDVDGRADQYALGCVLYEMVVGEPPFRREDTIQSLFAHANDAPPLIVTGDAVADARLNEVVTRALAKDPAVRFASCADLVAVAVGIVAAEGVAQVSSRTGTVIAPSPVGPTGTVIGDGRAAEPTSSPPPVREVAAKQSKTKFVVLGLVVAVLAVAGVGGYIVFASGSGSSTDASAVAQATATGTEPQESEVSAACVEARFQLQVTARYLLQIRKGMVITRSNVGKEASPVIRTTEASISRTKEALGKCKVEESGSLLGWQQAWDELFDAKNFISRNAYTNFDPVDFFWKSESLTWEEVNADGASAANAAGKTLQGLAKTPGFLTTQSS
jgi:serine/threonine-protein kinase